MSRKGAWLAALMLLLSVATTSAAAADETGNKQSVATKVDAQVVPIQVTGDPAERFTMVILGDGYTAAEMPKFRKQINKHLNVLWSIEPFRSYRNYFNIYAVKTPSPESGITCDPAHQEQRDTPLGMYFNDGCENPLARGILIDEEAARHYASLATSEYDQILALANTDTYGGIGGSVATTSGGHPLGPLITPHELGHSLGGLQDEYTYRERGVQGPPYTGGEPDSIHHTVLTKKQMREQHRKWWRWLGEESTSGGVIGRYEGGMYHSSDIWRPSEHSMMISLGYYFDQVSRERMTQRISAQADLIGAATPTKAPIGSNDVVWIETAHPVYHNLDISWRVDGERVTGTGGHALDLGALHLDPGKHTVSVTVTDPTEFVRDPAIRSSDALTATRSWTVRSVATTPSSSPKVAFTNSTPTETAVGGTDVIYVETTHPRERIWDVTWRLDGKVVPGTKQSRTLDLAEMDLSPGTFELTATVTDPAAPDGESDTLTWTVDNSDAKVTYDLSEPLSAFNEGRGSPHYVFSEEFTMSLDATDDQPGYVVREFRLDGDGWYNFYGWPSGGPESPFRFTPRGTKIRELIYGSLSSEGLSPQPWDARKPGYGTHTIEYRGIDTAGNIGAAKEFTVTVVPAPPKCTDTVSGRHVGPLRVSEGVMCLKDATVTGPMVVHSGASLVATDSSIAGPISTDGAEIVQLAESTVGGPARIDGTTGDVTILDTTIRGSLTLTNAQTGDDGAILAGSSVAGPLRCHANSAAPRNLGVSTTVDGLRTGECSDF